MRDAENGPGLHRRGPEAARLEVRILSGEEEARFGFLGAVGGLPVEHGVLFDVGGGSMQVTRFRQRRLTSAVSLPLGSLRLCDAFLKSDPPTAGEVRRLCDHARALLEEAGVRPLGRARAGGDGGHRAQPRQDRPALARLPGDAPARLRAARGSASRRSWSSSRRRKMKKRADIPGLNEDRGDSIVGGGLAIHTLMELLEADEVWVSGQGVREGLARSLMSDDLPAPARSGASVRALAARFAGWDDEPARPARRHREALLSALDLVAGSRT